MSNNALFPPIYLSAVATRVMKYLVMRYRRDDKYAHQRFAAAMGASFLNGRPRERRSNNSSTCWLGAGWLIGRMAGRSDRAYDAAPRR